MKKFYLILVIVSLPLLMTPAQAQWGFPAITSVTVDYSANGGNGALTISGKNFGSTPAVTLGDNTVLTPESGGTATHIVADFQTPASNFKPGSYLLIVRFSNSFTFFSVTLGASQDGGGLNGVKEFLASGTFIVPDHVSTILVEIYGAGGGGGGFNGSFGGCTGGGGAFSHSVIKVLPQASLNITVGAGGAAGINAAIATNGEDGGDSSVSFNGGKGGQSGANLTVTTGGFACTAAPGGAADPNAMISHAGQDGGGSGYQLIGFPSGTTVSAGGQANGHPNSVGQSGYVLLTF